MSTYAPQYLKRWALMHDAAEAYIGDMMRPIKEMLPEYVKLEERVLEVIAKKFGLDYPMPDEIKYYDDRMLVTEERDLFSGKNLIQRAYKLEPFDEKIYPWGYSLAKTLFLETAIYLGVVADTDNE